MNIFQMQVFMWNLNEFKLIFVVFYNFLKELTRPKKKKLVYFKQNHLN